MRQADESVMLPDDGSNRQLVANVHPSDWVNPEPSGRYNIVVIGAGTAGLITAVIAAGLGAKVALIEKHLMGGDCLNVGCVPSKGMIRESCTLMVLANQVSDQDGNDPPDNMVMNFVVGFSPFDVCAAPFTPIYTIQGNGLSTPIPGTVATKGVVVGDFEGSNSVGIQGFYLQDLTGDEDPATSDGIFVYTGNSNLVSVGQVVRVTGYARERFDQTTLNGSNSDSSAVPAANIVSCGTGSVAPTDVMMPFDNADYPERFEGMLVRFPQSLSTCWRP